MNTLLTLPPEPARFQQRHDSKFKIFQNTQRCFSDFLEVLKKKNSAYVSVYIEGRKQVCLHRAAFTNPIEEEETVIWDYRPHTLLTWNILIFCRVSVKRLT